MKRIVTHEIKLEKSTKIILLVMALGILAHAFQFTAPIEDALAETLSGKLSINLNHSGIATFMIPGVFLTTGNPIKSGA